MKHFLYVFGAILLACALLMVTTGCKKNTPIEEDGNIKDHTNPYAPKEIASTDITVFYCDFTTVAIPENDPELGHCSYRMQAEKKDQKVVCRYYRNDPQGETTDLSYETDLCFLEELQSLVAGYCLASCNGLDYHVSGLPDNFDSNLKVEYASGESIIASDNQNMIFSLLAMRDFNNLFRQKIDNTPITLDLTVSEEMIHDYAGESFVSSTYPIVELGYTDWLGKVNAPTEYDALSTALDRYNNEIYATQSSTHKTLIMFGSGLEQGDMLYTDASVYVTRNDSHLVSFYERTEMYNGRISELQYNRGFNFDVKTGNLLDASDVFHDLTELSELVADLLARDFPGHDWSDAAERIEDSLLAADDHVSFALSYDCVHILLEGIWIQSVLPEQHLILSYADYPSLVKQEYQTKPETYILPLDYDAYYPLADQSVLYLYTQPLDEFGAEYRWNAVVNGKEVSQDVYGYPPNCYLVQQQDRSYLYVTVPVGDISQRTDIYELTSNGAVYLSQYDAAISDRANLNPMRLSMHSNEIIFAGPIGIQPYGWYAVENGIPVLQSGYGLFGYPVTLQYDVEAVLASAEDPTVTDGTILLSAGSSLTPIRSDLQSYIDFLNDNGNVVRFEVENFSDEMEFIGYGTPDKLFD